MHTENLVQAKDEICNCGSLNRSEFFVDINLKIEFFIENVSKLRTECS